jgi:hypothetical protein
MIYQALEGVFQVGLDHPTEEQLILDALPQTIEDFSVDLDLLEYLHSVVSLLYPLS